MNAESLPTVKPKAKYVVGFLFSKYESVVLIKKQKPLWQKDRWNGVGGKIEETDASPLAAMIREFKEETDIDFKDWKYSGIMRGSKPGGEWEVHLFRGRYNGDVHPDCKVVGPDEEQAGWVALNDVHRLHTIPNIQYLVPMLYYFESSELANVTFEYQEFDDS